MKIIKCLSELIEDELDAADHYIQKAVKYKEEFPEVSKTFYNVSITHMDIIKTLHDQVTAIIANYRKDNGEPPAAMMTLYEYLHERHINKATSIRNLQDLYNKNY